MASGSKKVIFTALIGEAANPEVVAAIREVVGRFGAIEHVDEVAAMHMGPDYVVVNLSVDFSSTVSADGVEAIARQVDREIEARLPEVQRVFFEAGKRYAEQQRDKA